MSVITITAKRDGFRRCGKAHSDHAVTWPDGAFTDEEIAILKAEPMLVVYDGAAPAASDIQSKVDALTADKAALQSQVDTLTADKTALQSQADTLTADKTALQSQVDALTADKTALQSQVDTLTADKTALQSQVDELTAATAATTKASK